MRVWLSLVLVSVLACSAPERRLFTDASGDVDSVIDGASGCATDRNCDDRIACTLDHCRAGTCTHETCRDCCPVGLQCIDAFGCGRAPQACTQDSDCADSIRCTLDRCRDGRSCEHTPQEGLCDTGQICLAAVGCIRRPPDACTQDSDCNTSPCGGQWRCAPELGCQFRAATRCDDDIPCTTDLCSDALGGCQHAPRDSDADGHADQACGGDDCADDNRFRYPGATEICGNRVDEDCDGVDRGCCVNAQPCPTACGSVGTQICAASGEPERCAAPAETCNGRDDNCDGRTDEGCCSTTTPCTTVCGTAGSTLCDASGIPSGCRAPAELCNGRDDDCDGVIDNGFACTAGASGECTTACASSGRRSCLGSCVWDLCAPPAELCNGRDDNCDGRSDEGCCSAATPCTTPCGSTGSTLCNAAGIASGCRAPGEVCNGRDDDCDGAADNGFACAPGASGACTTACGSSGRRICLGSCAWDACAPPAESCNGADDNCNGSCDEGFMCCARSTRDCTALGFVSGTATCRGDCAGWDTSGCSRCGNRVRDGSELCDGADLGGATCASRGFGAGTLRCRTDCTLDTTGCSACGNARVDAGEACDGVNLNGQSCASLAMGFTGGTLSCTSSCGFNIAMCTRPFNPTGTWLVAPGVNHYCAFGLVSASFGNLNFNDTGAALSVGGGGVNCMMTGPSSRVTRRVNVTCTLTGGCNETYTLTGSYGADDRFTGTFTAGFTGGGCIDCSTRSYAVSASR